jgi:hypothetical protein
MQLEGSLQLSFYGVLIKHQTVILSSKEMSAANSTRFQ